MAKGKSKAKVAKKKEVVKVATEVKTEIKDETKVDDAALDAALDQALEEEKRKLVAEENSESESDELIDREISKVEQRMEVIGKVKSPVFQKSSFIKTKAYSTPICLYELPDDIRTYLTNKWWGTNVYEKWEEWLIRHWADMDMIEKLKVFISEHYL